jgi:hypothetical protein
VRPQYIIAAISIVIACVIAWRALSHGSRSDGE